MDGVWLGGLEFLIFLVSLVKDLYRSVSVLEGVDLWRGLAIMRPVVVVVVVIYQVVFLIIVLLNVVVLNAVELEGTLPEDGELEGKVESLDGVVRWWWFYYVVVILKVRRMLWTRRRPMFMLVVAEKVRHPL